MFLSLRTEVRDNEAHLRRMKNEARLRLMKRAFGTRKDSGVLRFIEALKASASYSLCECFIFAKQMLHFLPSYLLFAVFMV